MISLLTNDETFLHIGGVRTEVTVIARDLAEAVSLARPYLDINKLHSNLNTEGNFFRIQYKKFVQFFPNLKMIVIEYDYSLFYFRLDFLMIRSLNITFL